MYYIGIDAKPYWKGIPNNFTSTIACSIMVTDYNVFQKKYIATFNEVMKKNGIEIDRIIAKGYELNKIGVKFDVLKEIVCEVSKSIGKVFVHFAIFSLKEKNNVIKVPSRDGITTESVSIKNFLRNYLDNYFPLICYWDLQKNKSTVIGDECIFYLDSFQGRENNAWINVKHNNDFFVFPSGDRVNALISFSDILNHYLTEKLLRCSDALCVETIQKLLKEDFEKLDVEAKPISNWALYDIVPQSGGLIDIKKKLKHPIFCVLMEEESSIPKKVMENSPFLNQLYNVVLSKNGCLKFFDINQDMTFLTDEDYVIYYGKKGEAIVNELKNIGYLFKSNHIKDLFQN